MPPSPAKDARTARWKSSSRAVASSRPPAKRWYRGFSATAPVAPEPRPSRTERPNYHQTGCLEPCRLAHVPEKHGLVKARACPCEGEGEQRFSDKDMRHS